MNIEMLMESVLASTEAKVAHMDHTLLKIRETVEGVESTDSENQIPAIEELRLEYKRLQDEHDSKVQQLTTELQRKKVRAKTKAKKDEIDQEWRDGKERLIEEYYPLKQAIWQQIMSHPKTKSEQAIRNEIEIKRREKEESERRERELQEQKTRDDNNWQKILDMGGPDKVIAEQEASLSQVQGVLKRTRRNRNRIILQQRIDWHLRNIQITKKLAEKYAIRQ